MSASNAFETALQQFIFQGSAISALTGTLYISLHTADPGEAGTQTTSETTYTSYARAAVTRSSGGFTVTNNVASNAGVVNFPAATGGTSTVTHFGIGTAATGAGLLLFKGTLNSSLAISNGITPSFNAGDLTVNVD